jgi:hypothetical protein
VRPRGYRAVSPFRQQFPDGYLRLPASLLTDDQGGQSYDHSRAGDQVEACRLANTVARLMGTFQDGLLTLQKLRTGGSQTVTVQHVNVGAGGQAAIGNVRTGGADAGGSNAENG